MGDFWFKVFVIVVLMIGQGVLWAWIGFRAQQIFSWWPLKTGTSLINPSSNTASASSRETSAS